uniref:Ubiquitin hydrolase n=1 Tax=Tanacetum cinerariifolium TaxID=118510 RepID=A0A699HTY8_TANCI|nr:ubiquitin hydrolase [Tanacetum cinerariifolium]
MSWTGLPEFAADTVTDYSRPVPTVESSSDDAQNRNPSVTATEASPCTISPKPFIKFVKAADCIKVKTNKVEAARKSSVKYAEMYIRTSKSPNVRGNQRNWNNLKSQQLGNNFVMKKKACFNFGDFDHLAYDCVIGVKKGRTCPTNSHKTISPRIVIHKSHRPSMRPVRPNMDKIRRFSEDKKNQRFKSTEVVDYILQVKKNLLTKKLEDSEAEHQV